MSIEMEDPMVRKMDGEMVAKVLNAFDKYRNATNRIARIAKELGFTELEVQEIINTWSIYEKRPKE